MPWKQKRPKARDTDKDFDFMNVLLASKNLKIIWKLDKSLKNINVLKNDRPVAERGVGVTYQRNGKAYVFLDLKLMHISKIIGNQVG